jgi:hypothetical protein
MIYFITCTHCTPVRCCSTRIGLCRHSRYPGGRQGERRNGKSGLATAPRDRSSRPLLATAPRDRSSRTLLATATFCAPRPKTLLKPQCSGQSSKLLLQAKCANELRKGPPCDRLQHAWRPSRTCTPQTRPASHLALGTHLSPHAAPSRLHHFPVGQLPQLMKPPQPSGA